MLVHSLPYEKKIFSQNLEDGIIETLLQHLEEPNFFAIEIGSGDGTENMLRNLVVNHGYKGLGHDVKCAVWSHENYTHCTGPVQIDSIQDLVSTWPSQQPDLFSLDIDSFDFWIMKTLLELGFRPSVLVLEYLSYFGPDSVCAVKPGYDRYSWRCCGASLAAWKWLTTQFDYDFFTVDSSGVNAFFYHRDRVDRDRLQSSPTHQWREYPKYVHHDWRRDEDRVWMGPA